jgi:hypothetical protein
MTIELTKVKVKDLVEGYENSDEEGVVAYNGNLNIRPKYQREFIYKEEEERAVIDTILKGFPLNSMYWVDNGDGTYEVLDGQQRTISICNFADGITYIFLEDRETNITNLKRIRPDLYNQFMNYELFIYVCKGSKDEQLDWFTTINIASKALTDQELMNINYTGDWLTSAKKYFSKTGCAAVNLAQAKSQSYIGGTANRQDILELVLRWITDCREKKEMKKAISGYMAKHQFDSNANELWEYFESVINWVKTLFPDYTKEMKRDDWGFLYNEYHEEEYDPDELSEIIHNLYADEDITAKKGIYPYLFDNNEKHLSIRKFKEADRATVYHKQKGICPKCEGHFPLDKMEADHIVPWSKGGRTILSNLQMLCKKCNKDKSSGE